MSETMTELWMPRDASWHPHPEVHNPKKLHRCIPGTNRPLCGRMALLVMELGIENPHASRRCQRCEKCKPRSTIG